MAKRGTHKPRALTVQVYTKITITAEMYDWLLREAGQEHTISDVVRMALEQYRAYVEGELTN